MILNGGYKSGNTLVGGYTGTYTGGSGLSIPATMYPGQSITITWSGLGTTQGTGGVTIGGVAQTITSWSDVQIVFTVVQGGMNFGPNKAVVITTDGGTSYSGETELIADAGSRKAYVNMTAPVIDDSSSVAYQTTAVVAVGDQFEYQDNNFIGSETHPLIVDGRGYITSLNEEGTFLGRFWDATDSTWGPWETFTAALVSGQVQSVDVPVSGTYVAGDSLSFTVNYDTAQTVTGTPIIPLTSGTGTFSASYVSGSGTTALVFTAVIPSGTAYTGTLSVGSAIELNGGIIQNSNDVAANLTLANVGSTTGVLLDTTNPSVVSVAVPAAATYSIGENLDFTVTFSETVTITGVPRLRLSIGGVTKYASFVNAPSSTTALFRYTVVAGDSDSNGIDVNALELNGGSIQDAAGNSLNVTLNGVGATSGVLINTSGPQITSVSVPADGIYNEAEVLSFTVNYSAAVTVTGTPRLPIVAAGTTVYADYTSGTGTAALVFSYTVPAGVETSGGILLQDLILNGGTLKDASGLNASLVLAGVPDTAGIEIDSQAPVGTVDSITTSFLQPALTGTVDDPNATIVVSPGSVSANNVGNGTWTLAAGLIGPLSSGLNTVTAVFTDTEGHQSSASGIVNVETTQIVVVANDLTTEDDTPVVTGTVSVTPANVTVTAQGNTYPAVLSGSNWSAQITSPLPLGTTEITVDAIAANGTTDQTTAQITIADTTAPVIDSVTAPAAGVYVQGDVLRFEVTFNKNVQVTGTPRLPVPIGVNTRNFSYVDGAGSKTLGFEYTVVVGDNEHSEITASTLELNGGTIRDEAGNDAILAFPNTESSGVIIDTEAAVLTVDAQTTINTAPEITGTSSEPSASHTLTVAGIDYQVAVRSDGTWRQQLGSLNAGSYTVRFNAVDLAGNVSTEATAILTIQLPEEVSDPNEPDRLTLAMTLLKRRLGRYTDNPSNLDEHILAELKAAQERLENKTALPWFLKARREGITTTPGVDKITLPLDFIRLREDWEYPVQLKYDGKWRRLGVYSYDQFWDNTSEEGDVPTSAAQDGPTIILGPTPTGLYPIRLGYYKKEFVLNPGKVVSNAWLKYAFDLIISEAGFILANNYLKNQEAAAQFQAEIVRAERDLRMTTIAYETAAMESWELNNDR